MATRRSIRRWHCRGAAATPCPCCNSRKRNPGFQERRSCRRFFVAGLSGCDSSDFDLSDFDVSDLDVSDLDVSDLDLSDLDASALDLPDRGLPACELFDGELAGPAPSGPASPVASGSSDPVASGFAL